jgi:hypothetical protein
VTTAERVTHDYRDNRRGWGHDISYELLPGNRLRASGWGPSGRYEGVPDRRIERGDYILLSNPKGGETRYRFTEVRYSEVIGGPKDQWFATLDFAPRAG